MPFNVIGPPHIHCRLGLVEDFFFLEIMASRMATFYKSQVVQMNEESAPESFLDLTLVQHLHDEHLKSREVRICFEVNPFRA